VSSSQAWLPLVAVIVVAAIGFALIWSSLALFRGQQVPEDNNGVRANEIDTGLPQQRAADAAADDLMKQGELARSAGDTTEAGTTPSPSPSPRHDAGVRPGTSVLYECLEINKGHSKRYQCWLKVLEQGSNGVHYRWETREAGRVTDAGDRWCSGMATSRTFNFWWSRGERGYETADTAPWLSRAVFDDLKRGDRAEIVVEEHSRTDVGVRAWVEGREIRADGLSVLTLRTTRGDRIALLDDAENPLVLEISVPGLYSLEAVDVQR